MCVQLKTGRYIEFGLLFRVAMNWRMDAMHLQRGLGAAGLGGGAPFSKHSSSYLSVPKTVVIEVGVRARTLYGEETGVLGGYTY